MDLDLVTFDVPRPRRPIGVVVLLLLAAVGLWWGLTRDEDCGPLAELAADDDDDAPELAPGLVCRGEVELVGPGVVVEGRLYARAQGPRLVVVLPADDAAAALDPKQRAGQKRTFVGRVVDPERAPAAVVTAVRRGLELGADPFLLFEPR